MRSISLTVADCVCLFYLVLHSLVYASIAYLPHQRISLLVPRVRYEIQPSMKRSRYAESFHSSPLFFVAVMSLLVGQSITHITATNPNITGPEIAVTLSLLTGAIALAIGLVRLGILVDFIPRK